MPRRKLVTHAKSLKRQKWNNDNVESDRSCSKKRVLNKTCCTEIQCAMCHEVLYSVT